MAHDSFRAALASRVKSQDQVKHTLAGICVSATRMYNFSAGISMEEFLLRECYQDFASRQDSCRDPGEEYFSWRDPGEYRFPGGILAEIRSGNFSLKGSRRESGPPRRDPAGIPVSAGNLGGIPAK